MAALASSRRICSAGVRLLAGAERSPFAAGSRSQCAQREKAIEDTKLMLEKELNQLKTNMEKRFIDQERSFDKAVLELRYDLKKDADQQNLKHYVDLLKVKLEIKANDFKMEEMLKSQGHKFDLKIRDHDIRTLKGLGWFFGFSTVFLCRSLLFGSDSKKTSSSE
ncbi:uncharacterized protein LOC120679641 isoform X3 [Panicum virgatum]|uniref:uncharacterized protein LOC120679641 isoform X3 n=1 Tax=Panicum virgatum TaxID=38727 RepID=UPI0019D652EA|nr:uncharacterized protein LOC120679641 isoform X3 [Panicum virgatum]